MKNNRYRKVLLIDDNEIDNFINERMITSSGFSAEVIVKNSADAALHFLKNLSNDQDYPEIIFLDIRMPIMDGFGFLDAFNNLPDSIKLKSKVVMLSSTLDPEDNERAATYPVVIKMLMKPLNIEQLASI